MSQDMTDSCMQDWTERESAAESMIPMIGGLYRKNNVVTSIYGRPIINRSVIELLKAHRFRASHGRSRTVGVGYPSHR